jgi:uncharacterized protein YqkB
MSCASGGNGCNSGDVVASGSTGEMSNSFTPEVSGNYALIFKTTRQNWSSAFINDQLVIDIKDINNIVEFKLNRVHYKEYLLLKIANVVLYAWPFAVQHGMKMDTLQPCFLGGDDYPSHLLIDSSKIFAKYKVGCVKRDRRNPIDTLVNIDIKPYLKNGRNIINMTGFEAYSGGFAHVYFTVRMKCPPKCTETWSNGCSALEARK